MKAHLFIVEDEMPIITLLKYNLEKEGYKISFAVNGTDALRDIKEKNPDLIFDRRRNPTLEGISLFDALVFRNSEYNTNGNFTGMSDDNEQTYGNANLNDFKPSGPQTQQEKVMQLYNSNEYLPNNNMLDKQLTKGFQILDNPVSVSNPNLIPVLKSIPVSSVMGSNRNQTYDVRSEPPCPKTVVSPFLTKTSVEASFLVIEGTPLTLLPKSAAFFWAKIFI